ncbi:MAG: MerR family transcriptional regulator [Candidatus Babeliales bacterium]
MKKRKFRIGELAKQLQVERFVVRFWEKEFSLKTSRSTGGQRFYEEKDLEAFKYIKELLYEKGFTISGAKKQLKTMKKTTSIRPSRKTTIDSNQENKKQSMEQEKIEVLSQQIIDLKNKLRELRKLL